MSDQEQSVDELASALSDDSEVIEDDFEPTDEDEQLEDDGVEEEEPDEEPEEEEEPEPEVYQVTVKDENGNDVQKELSLEDLAQGYMLQAAFTRGRQKDSEQVREIEARAANETTQLRQEAISQIEQMQTLVQQTLQADLQELSPQLANSDPARYVELQAKQQQYQQTMGQLSQFKQQQEQQAQQQEIQMREQLLNQYSQELDTAVPEFKDAGYKEKLSQFAEQAYGIQQNDLAYLLSAPVFKDGGVLDGSVVVKVFSDAMKYQALQKEKPIAQKKLNKAPRVIKPNAPKPRNRNSEAAKRLAKTGRVEDLAAFL